MKFGFFLSLSNMCQADLFKEILMIINTNSRRRARERERQNDAHGIVYALAERTNCICEDKHLNPIQTPHDFDNLKKLNPEFK